MVQTLHDKNNSTQEIDVELEEIAEAIKQQLLNPSEKSVAQLMQKLEELSDNHLEDDKV